jgi:hypothetical protein
LKESYHKWLLLATNVEKVSFLNFNQVKGMTSLIVRFSPRAEDLQRLQVGPIGPHLQSFAALVYMSSMWIVHRRKTIAISIATASGHIMNATLVNDVAVPAAAQKRREPITLRRPELARNAWRPNTEAAIKVASATKPRIRGMIIVLL